MYDRKDIPTGCIPLEDMLKINPQRGKWNFAHLPPANTTQQNPDADGLSAEEKALKIKNAQLAQSYHTIRNAPAGGHTSPKTQQQQELQDYYNQLTVQEKFCLFNVGGVKVDFIRNNFDIASSDSAQQITNQFSITNPTETSAYMNGRASVIGYFIKKNINVKSCEASGFYVENTSLVVNPQSKFYKKVSIEKIIYTTVDCKKNNRDEQYIMFIIADPANKNRFFYCLQKNMTNIQDDKHEVVKVDVFYANKNNKMAVINLFEK